MNIINKIKYYWQRRNSQAYIQYLRRCGITIGEGTICKYPRTIEIDTSRPDLLEIGNNVLLHKNLTILSHDYASRVFVNLYHEFIPSHGKITIGNNVWFGEKCTVLKGVKIGDNCIIGYGSVVIKDIPANSVAVGCPAKVICSLEEYYQKRKKEYINEVFEYAECIRTHQHREPIPKDFTDDYPIFVDKYNIKDYPYFPYKNVFTSDLAFNEWLKSHKAPFNSFEDFMNEFYNRFGK